MELETLAEFDFVDADKSFVERVKTEWGEWASCEMHIDDGFSVAVLYHERIVGLLSVYWRDLPPPLLSAREGYIDILWILEPYHRRGIARQLLGIAEERARAEGVCQLRSWSTNDKTEAIPMWMALGFALCPVTHSQWGPEVAGYFVAKRMD